jgi:phosphatidate cytidylyltransferase
MTAQQPAPAVEATGLRSNLAQRVMAALVLAPIALGAAYFGGWIWFALACAIGLGLFLEWLSVIGLLRAGRVAILGIAILGAVAVILATGGPGMAMLAAAVGAGMLAFLATSETRAWAAAGLVYASAAIVATVVVRGEALFGFVAVLFVFAVVWVTDILGYFAGRGFGGPKLWPRVSPKKTWAGAIGGFVGSIVVGVAFAAFGAGRMAPLVILSALLSVVSQAGDLFESALKRRFDVKDSSHLIPGHGGLLDRLDGYVAVVAAAALIGSLRAGDADAARGLLQW